MHRQAGEYDYARPFRPLPRPRFFPDPASLAAGTVDEIRTLIKSISYPNSKAEHLHAMAVKLMADFGGVVPDNMDDLKTLPGVGRKTANVVMAVAFRRPAMPVDTHVFRVSNRIGLADNAPLWK